ncbi:hypothetical protein [Methyloceanibacter sp.]|uniref:hypothetical protein n=1 Tax=Methyloceanibacter sp. TaxID=1965321 RepID=UPI003D6CFB5D
MKVSYRGLVVTAVSGLAVWAIARAMRLLHYTLTLDQAYFVESFDTTFRYGVPRSRMLKSITEYFKTIIDKDVATVCQMPLPVDHGPMMNVFSWHSLPILYLIAPLKLFFDGTVIVATLTALTFVLMIVIVYVAARRRSVPVLAAFSFAFLVTAHPVWSHGMFWQIYPDRFFMVFGLLYAIALVSYFEEDRRSPAWLALLVVSAVLATSCTERAGMMISAYTFGCLLLFRGLHYRRLDLFPLAIAVATAAYVLVYMRFFQDNYFYAGFSYFFLPRIVEILRHGLDEASTKFLLVNALGLGLLSLFQWRLALLAAGAMLPNILGSLGGVEKSGWYSHYHSLYFTFLVAAALFGMVRLHQLFPDRLRTILASVGMIFCGVLLLLINSREPIPLLAFSFSNLRDYAPVKVVRLIADTKDRRDLKAREAMLLSAAAAVPPGATVSGVDPMMPALYDDKAFRHISVYPLGIGEAEYVVVPYKKLPDGRLELSGVVNFGGPEAQKKIAECMSERLASSGFRPTLLVPAVPDVDWGMAVLRRQ